MTLVIRRSGNKRIGKIKTNSKIICRSIHRLLRKIFSQWEREPTSKWFTWTQFESCSCVYSISFDTMNYWSDFLSLVFMFRFFLLMRGIYVIFDFQFENWNRWLYRVCVCVLSEAQQLCNPLVDWITTSGNIFETLMKTKRFHQILTRFEHCGVDQAPYNLSVCNFKLSSFQLKTIHRMDHIRQSMSK